jgi:carboxypeptidase Taq
MQAYKQLEERFGKVTALREVSSFLGWDRSVLMPELGVDQRARQNEVLSVLMHELQTAPEVGEWLAKVDRKKLNDWERANVDVMEWLYTHATAVPADLVAKKMNQETKVEVIWRKARAESNFAMVRDELAKLLDITREHADVKAKKLKKPLYDALMDSYVPHMTSQEVDVVFDDLAAFIPPFLDAALECQKEPLPLKGPYPQAQQEKLGRELCGFLGFDFKWGRLDTSTHPFSMGIGDDVRITTRYDESDFLSSLQAVAHEAGHGFYDRHTPKEWHHQPVGASQNMGMGIHESQSLSLDMQLARSREYWEFMAPHVQKAFGRNGPELSAENLYRSAIKAERGFIRVEADEITYPAHVILRYRLEKQMIEGKLEVKDLPDAWNAAFKGLIGVTPPNDRLGCLQDIHWYSGAFGYFPAYALGAIIAAQLADKMKRDIPDLSAQMRKGNFAVFTNWLRDNVQAKACLYRPQELIEKATGEKMSTHYFKKHLTERYLEKAYGGEACSNTSAPGAKRRA